eukprot:7326138-Karenia_brevis.AAC.1
MDNASMAPARQAAMDRTRVWITESLEFIADFNVQVDGWKDVTPMSKPVARPIIGLKKDIVCPHVLRQTESSTE